MRVHNHLPRLLECVARWERAPDQEDFLSRYYEPMSELAEPAFGDGFDLHLSLEDLDWSEYRREVLQLDPVREEERARKHLKDVESLFGFELQGDVLLFGAFATMDGYARFERGNHCVFLGVDESHGRGQYLDVLEVHELTHVARESRPEVWRGWGLDPKMSHDDFVEHQPVIEHLFGEGFSCAVSELLVPCEDRWHYAYQEKADLERIFRHAASVDQVVHRELKAGKDADWGRLYSPNSYRPQLPVFTHYVWGWQWARHLLNDRYGGDPRRIVEVCSREFVEDALAFRLAEPGVSV